VSGRDASTWDTVVITDQPRSRRQDLKVRAFGTDERPRVGTLIGPARFVARPTMRMLFRARVEGLEHVPTEGPAIISPNHRSFFDSPLVMAMSPRPVVFLGKAEYMDRARTKYVFPALGMVPIRRDVKKAAMAALTTAAELLDDGRLVGIYPEGTRSRDGLLHRGHSGVAHLAVITGAPIIPVGLVGTERVQPIGAAVPRPFRGPVTIRFGEPIDPRDYRFGGSRKRRQQMLDDAMAAIAAMTSQRRSSDFSSRQPPLIRGGSESVYRLTTHGATGINWRHAAERAVAEGCRKYDDARVGAVHELRCRVLPSGELAFETELTLSTRYRKGTK
jgi:1-acyl-sn-glycerol-3-phosphate acyltransferase